MPSETKQLRSLVAAWEKKKRYAEKMVVRLRHALDLAEKDPESRDARQTVRRVKKAVPLPAPLPPAPFTPKYPRPAKSYILEVLSDGPALALRDIKRALAARGFHYTEQALALSMNSLVKAGHVKKRRAPNGSAAHYIFEFVKKSEATL